jgi:hypothetical protein
MVEVGDEPLPPANGPIRVALRPYDMSTPILLLYLRGGSLLNRRGERCEGVAWRYALSINGQKEMRRLQAWASWSFIVKNAACESVDDESSRG